jgi:glycosyltransferase involved in cell wall biosynthesis
MISIVIPTYNRAIYLNYLLGDICKEIESIPKEIEIKIIVIDNCSNDETIDVVKEWQSIIPTLTLQRNSANIGIEGNLILGSICSQSEYTWMLSDHQRIRKGVFMELIELLNSQKPDIVVMDIEQWPSKYFNYNVASRTINKINKDELGEILWLNGNVSTNLFKTSIAKSTARESVRIAYSFYPNMAKFSALDGKSVLSRIKNATSFPTGSLALSVKRNYDTFNASFKEHILITKKITHNNRDLRWSVNGFQNVYYRKALVLELLKILLVKQVAYLKTMKSLFQAFRVNATSFFLGQTALILFIAMLIMFVPFKFRRLVCVQIIKKFSSNFNLIRQIEKIS